MLTAAAETSIDNFIASADIVVLNNTYFETIDQSDDACFYLPDLAPGEPVIIVGQCDPNIKVVQDFQPHKVRFRRIKGRRKLTCCIYLTCTLEFLVKSELNPLEQTQKYTLSTKLCKMRNSSHVRREKRNFENYSSEGQLGIRNSVMVRQEY